ncbi:luc7-like protein 3 [Selaginella moellendorffii]|nr:luc7-like protein 3 [Selaginella moellendorffii]|eukprot:XP_024535839.1 luc7-like protein 3 [Selaginella moellendorffii]
MDPKALLDELMGKDRDLPLGQKRQSRLRFDDAQVCHYHLVSFCPHDLFPNTKSDLGPCGKVHDDALREPFRKSNKVAQYEMEFLRYLERLISDLERKIRRCYERLEKEVPVMEQNKGGTEKISAISLEVQALLKRAEKEGEEGMVDQAQATMEKVEILNREKELIMRAIMPEYGTILEKEKRMQVCEICGAMQASTDTEKRLASHLEGRQHVGYLKIRNTLEELRRKRDEELEAKKKERMQESSVEEKLDLKDSPTQKNGAYQGGKGNEWRSDKYKRQNSDRRHHGGFNRNRGHHGDRERNRDGDRHRSREWRSESRKRSRSRSKERSRERS